MIVASALECKFNAETSLTDVCNARVARRMVVAPHRSGGQVQYIEKPIPRHIDSNRLEPAITWALKNLTKPLTIDELASKATIRNK